MRNIAVQTMHLLTWILLLAVGYYDVSANKDNLDFITIYRLPSNIHTSKVIKEFYQNGDALGMLLKVAELQYIDSAEGAVPLKCSPAGVECKWTLSEGWGYTDVSSTEDEDFSIFVKDDEYLNKKRGCIAFSRVTCYCPNGYINKYDSCINSQYSSTIVTKPGEIREEGHLTKKWLVIPPRNSTAVLDVASRYASPYSNNHIVTVNKFRGIGMEQRMLHFQNGDQRFQSKDIFDITHHNSGITTIKIDFIAGHLTLLKERGTLSYEIKLYAKYICVTVIYASSSDNPEALSLKADLSNGTNIEIPRVLEREFSSRQFRKWKLQRFSTPVDENNGSVRLVLNVAAKGTILHSIIGCRNFGNGEITSFSNVQSVPEVTETVMLQTYEGISKECYNGGKYTEEERKCICPVGFTGQRCEEACGPNYVGNNCTAICSEFSEECSGIIFCKSGFPCTCGPGYRGNSCVDVCNTGFYGPSCRQKCGQCLSNRCDKYTGLCDGGCQSGFHPPYCHIPYSYPAQQPRVSHQDFKVVTIETDASNVKGIGKAQFYQIQHRKSENTADWVEEKPKPIYDEIITANVSGIEPGKKYEVRVVYIDKDGSSYQGPLVPKIQFFSICTAPTSSEYNFRNESTSSTIRIFWKYSIKENDCPATGYTVVLRRRWSMVQVNVTSSSQSFNFEGLRSGITYEVRVRAITQFGEAPFSPLFLVKTKDNVPFPVTNLKVTKNGNGRLRVTWKPPRFTGGSLTEYNVQYHCNKNLACPHACSKETRRKTVGAHETFAELNGLLPHVQYYVEVAAKSNELGLYRAAYGLTQDAAPSGAPRGSATPVVSSKNTTLTVQWLPIENCTQLNGYFVGYHYELRKEDNTLISQGDITSLNVTFRDLTPQTLYLVNIYVISTGGWNETEMLVINTTTAGTVPEKVQDLAVYKRGRRAIGLRWASPTNSYGEINTFSVSYCESNNCAVEVNVHIAPVTCNLWPNYFCYTINNLLPNKQYSLSVRAQNVNVHGFGEVSTVTGVTSEGVPDAPIDVRMVSRTTNSLTLEWKPPRMFNGFLRSFLVNVEQTDSANVSNCCAYSPLQEFHVKEEKETYTYEVKDLIPASKYFVGISAKTISIGPSSSVTTSTLPEIPEMHGVPQMIDNNRVIIPAVSNSPGLTSIYLLLVTVPESNSSSVIWDAELAEKLRAAVNEEFYVIAEYSPEDMVSPFKVEIGGDVEPRNGTVGILEDRFLPPEFKVGLGFVHDYSGAQNVGFVLAKSEDNTDSSGAPS